MRKFIVFFTAALCCTLSMIARPPSGYYTDPALDELRIEIDDLKYALNSTQVELNLLNERMQKQNTKSQVKESGSANTLATQVNTLERKVLHCEKTLEKIAADLRNVSQSSNQVLNKIQTIEQEISLHDKRLDEVSKLKGTLTTISKAISQKSSNNSETSTRTYRVKAGDSLEKIARHHRISTEDLRKINQISNDKIIVGQELRLPDATQ